MLVILTEHFRVFFFAFFLKIHFNVCDWCLYIGQQYRGKADTQVVVGLHDKSVHL